MMEEKVTIEGESMMEEKVTIEGEYTREEKATMERGTPMENEMKKGATRILTKKKEMAKKKEDVFRLILYERTIGTNSNARKLLPLAKNYIIFIGAVTLMHLRGQELALPPPI